MRRSVSFALAGLVATAVSVAAQKVNPKDPGTIMRITQMGFQPLQAEGKVLILDVRDKTSFDGGRIPGAVHVPFAEVEKRIEEIRTKAAGRPIIAYCACPQEHTAAEAGLILHKNGLTDIRVLIGGYPDWVRSGGKIEKD